MAVTILGIAVVVLVKNPEGNNLKFSHSIKGIVYALVGALVQALGLICSKIGMGDYIPLPPHKLELYLV